MVIGKDWPKPAGKLARLFYISEIATTKSNPSKNRGGGFKMETAEVGGVIAIILAIVVVVVGSRYYSRRKENNTDEDA